MYIQLQSLPHGCFIIVVSWPDLDWTDSRVIAVATSVPKAGVGNSLTSGICVCRDYPKVTGWNYVDTSLHVRLSVVFPTSACTFVLSPRSFSTHTEKVAW